MTEKDDMLAVHETNGGPFALLPRSKLRLWGGVAEKKLARRYRVYANDYELACRSNLEIDYCDIGGQDALFIQGAQYVVLSISDEDALKFMCPFTMEDGQVRKEYLVAAFGAIDWSGSSRLKIATGDDYCLFDSAYSGEDVLNGRTRLFETVALRTDVHFLHFRLVTLTLADGNILDGFACMTSRDYPFR